MLTKMYIKIVKFISIQLILFLLLNPFNGYAQGVAINGTGTPPDNSAMLDVNSTNKGFLLPRLTSAQRDGIASPATGLMILNTDINCFETYINGSWQNLKCFGCNPSIDFHPIDTAICASGNTSFSVNASGNNLSYQWQEDDGGGFTNLSNGGVYSGVTTSKLKLTGAGSSLNNYKYRVVVSGECSPGATSNIATLIVSPASPAISVHPSDKIFTNGDTITLNVTSSNATSYQWQESTNNGTTWNDISDGGTLPTYAGATTSSLMLQNTDSTNLDSNLYRLVVSNACGSITSNSARTLFCRYLCAEGGTITEDGNYRIHSFTTNGNFEVIHVGNNDPELEALIIAGGGGYSYYSGAGFGAGGGAGEMIEWSGFSLTSTVYPIVVGGAGTYGSSTNGGNGGVSSFNGNSANGGGGGNVYATGLSGGSGGGSGTSAGGSSVLTGTSGTSFGFAGGTGDGTNSGGGGGAGGVGTISAEGPGRSNSITGTSISYASGGRNNNNETPGSGGSHFDNAENGIVIIRYRYK